MTVTNGYITSDDAMAFVFPATNEAARPVLDLAVNAASRMIDTHCGRRFYADSVTSARTFYVDNFIRVQVDDISTTSSLAVATDENADGVYETTWVAADYVLEPLNAIGPNGQAGWPYDLIRATGNRWFPITYLPGRTPRLQVTAKWGWAAIPDDVAQACRLLTAQLYRSKDAPFGVAGVSDMGTVQRIRNLPVVEELLAMYVRADNVFGIA